MTRHANQLTTAGKFRHCARESLTRNTLGRHKRHSYWTNKKTREREAMLKCIRELDAEIAQHEGNLRKAEARLPIEEQRSLKLRRFIEANIPELSVKARVEIRAKLLESFTPLPNQTNLRFWREKPSGQTLSNSGKNRCMKIVLLPIGFVLASVYAEAQQRIKVPRIGLLAFAATDAVRQKPFLQGLRDLGWIEGQNITIEHRYANGSYTRLAEIAAELAHLKVDVIVVRDSVAIPPISQATKPIPIVIVVSGDPIADGVIDSLARPGGKHYRPDQYLTAISG